MARKAFVSSAIATDDRIAEIAQRNPLAALMWPLVLTDFDDWARAEASARGLKLRIFPAIDIVTEDVTEEALQLYAEFGLTVLYEDTTRKGKRCMAIDPAKWYRYQTHIQISKRGLSHESRYPMPPQFASFYEQFSEEADADGHERRR
jgi:hypothetical protein